jgi:hypothetical protein
VLCFVCLAIACLRPDCVSNLPYRHASFLEYQHSHQRSYFV